jgi:CheY-like chemotaxis protein
MGEPQRRVDGPGDQAVEPDTVLVVDDNEITTLVAAALLEQLGWRHASAADGEQGLQALQRQRFAAVLMDCHMPVLDGWEATRRWRRGEMGRRLPIIGITANATAEDRQSCLDAGMDDHLPKPFDKSELDAALRRLVGPAPGPAAR